MSFLSAVGGIFKAITAPLGVLDDWAREPLKRWENAREQANRDRDVERDIRRQTGVDRVQSELRQEEARQQSELRQEEARQQRDLETHKSELRQEEARQQSKLRQEEARQQRDLETHKSKLRQEEARQQCDLEIRMRTEVERINAETEQWTKDQEFQRMKNVADALVRYREELTQLQINTIRAIGNMDIELRARAQDLILSKTKEYKALQDQATKDAEDEFCRILDKFSGNERILNIMISNSDKKLASIINSTTMFLEELRGDISKMNENIDMITRSGQAFIDRQIESQFNKLSLPASDDPKLIN